MAIVVHIGIHKTGTTAIQRFAARHRRPLRARGLWYPSYKGIGLFGHYGHHHFAHAIAGEVRNGFDLDAARRFMAYVREKVHPGQTPLLSAEPMYRQLLGEGTYWQRRRAYVRQLRDVIGDKDVRVLAVLRRQDSFARSLYQENVKVNASTMTFREFVADRPELFDYYDQLSLFREMFGSVQVLVYEDLARQGLIDAFYAELGIEVSDLERPDAINRSLPIELVEFKRRLNDGGLDPERLKEIGLDLARAVDNEEILPTGNFDWLPQDEMRAFTESFAEKNERLRQDFAPELTAPLFPEPAWKETDAPAPYDGMSPDRYAELAAVFVRPAELAAGSAGSFAGIVAPPPVAEIVTLDPASLPVFGRGRHIALVIERLVNRSGGAERLFCDLAGMLIERGYEVTCLYYEPRDGRPFYPLDPRAELINLQPQKFSRGHRFLDFLHTKIGIPVPSVRDQVSWRLRTGRFVSQLHDYYRLVRPDVAIGFLPPANTPALLASAGTDVKVIPTNHNVPEQDYLNPDRWNPNPVDRRLRIEALRHAAAIHVIFPHFGEWFPAPLRDRVVAIPNYVTSAVRRTRTATRRERTIVAVGRLADVKGFDILLAAWAKIAADYPEWSVLVFGEGPKRAELQKSIVRLRVADSFELAGHHADLTWIYGRAAILCHPAHHEGFGLAVAEGLALGVPVVAFSDCAGVDQLVTDGYNGVLVDRAGGADALAEGLRRLMDDVPLRERLGGNGPASVAAYTEERFGDAWARLIESVCEPARQRGRP